jgi:hypothetical protein
MSSLYQSRITAYGERTQFILAGFSVYLTKRLIGNSHAKVLQRRRDIHVA